MSGSEIKMTHATARAVRPRGALNCERFCFMG
jgi:hypothetical protein